MTGSLNMNSQKIINLATPTLSTDATTKAYVDAQFSGAGTGDFKANGTVAMTGNLNMNTSNKIVNLAAPTLSADATNKTYVDTADALKLSLAGGTMTG